MGDKSPRYWPAVFAEARQLSKEYFAWKIPLLIFGAVSLFIALAEGEKKAAEYVAAALGGGGAAVLVAFAAYVVNVVRASGRLYRRERERADIAPRHTSRPPPCFSVRQELPDTSLHHCRRGVDVAGRCELGCLPFSVGRMRPAESQDSVVTVAGFAPTAERHHGVVVGRVDHRHSPGRAAAGVPTTDQRRSVGICGWSIVGRCRSSNVVSTLQHWSRTRIETERPLCN
jgi:hypothetical protein